MKNTRYYLSVLLSVCIIVCSVLAFTTYSAALNEHISEEIFGSEEELQPTSASSCTPTPKVIYVYSSINISGNEPNATYIYCSGGGGGEIGGAIAGGTVYSIAQMNSLGQTMWRQDLRSYNGTPLHHGSVYGPHQHNYTWSSYTASSGKTFWNFIESIIGLS